MTIKEMRVKAGLTQAQVLEGYPDRRLGVSELSKIENGIVEAPNLLFKHIANKCGYLYQSNTEEATEGFANAFPRECRRQSYKRIGKAKSYIAILNTLQGRELTAREIGRALKVRDLNEVKPRICELYQGGKIKAVGKKRDLETGRSNTVWAIA